MKKLMITIAAMSAFGVAMPANAQYRGPNNWGPNFDNRIEALESQIQRGVQRGAITYREARPLREDVRKLDQLERQYSRGGFTRSEQDKLQRRIQSLREKIEKAERNGRNDRNDRAGYGYDRDGYDRGRDGRPW